MFSLLALKILEHPQLGNLELSFVDEDESKNRKKPYTSVIIGPNGTGKSFILRTLADIFSQTHNYKKSGEKHFNLPYSIHLRYKLSNVTYEIISNNLIIYEKRGPRRSFYFFKNRPPDFDVFPIDKIHFAPVHGYEISIKELELPSRLIVSSVMLNDRFIYQNSKPTNFYQYLGVRSSNSGSSTRASVRRTISNLFIARSSSEGFVKNVADLLKFLEFQVSFKIHYKTKINALFFSGNLTKKDFRQYFEHWWDPNFKYSGRDKENPLWSIPYYNENFRNNESKTGSLIKYLNVLAKDERRIFHKERSKSKLLKIDLFDRSLSVEDLEMVRHLENLDIINLDGINIKKAESDLSINDISSGEYHLLISLIGIFSKIEPNSLVLIDEPEISLHPNWQMRYASFLKDVFRKFPTTHFVLTTHSHFVVSDLEGPSSSVISLSRNSDNSIVSELVRYKDTFGWSAEEVLLKVFKVATSRNYYVAEKLGLLLDYIANENSTNQSIRTRFYELGLDKVTGLTDEDPLKTVYDTIIEEYVS